MADWKYGISIDYSLAEDSYPSESRNFMLSRCINCGHDDKLHYGGENGWCHFTSCECMGGKIEIKNKKNVFGYEINKGS